jgi:hypothetical protein
MSYTYAERATLSESISFLRRLDVGARISARNLINDPQQSNLHPTARQILNSDPPRVDWCSPLLRRVALSILARLDVPATAIEGSTEADDIALQPFIDTAVAEVSA